MDLNNEINRVETEKENIKEENKENLGNESNDKMETKGLKLKKITKDKLNEIQNRFGDAETMISSLIEQYYTYNINTEDKYGDRKAEIEKFNYLIESMKSSFINSLDMALYAEKKFEEKFKEQLLKKDALINGLQEEKNQLIENLKIQEEKLIKNEYDINEIKESYSRLNKALTTVEKELNDKNIIISNNQKHISSLTLMVEQNKETALNKDELSKKNEDLKEQLAEARIIKFELENKKIQMDTIKNENSDLKKELKEANQYAKELNAQIQNTIKENANEIAKVVEERNRTIRELENKKNEEILRNNKLINELNNKIVEIMSQPKK